MDTTSQEEIVSIEPSPTGNSCTTCSTVNSSQITGTYPVQEYTKTVYTGNNSSIHNDDDIILQPSNAEFLTPVSLHVCRCVCMYVGLYVCMYVRVYVWKGLMMFLNVQISFLFTLGLSVHIQEEMCTL